jgi:hypothetical protein
MLPDPPPGWAELQQAARRAKDATELARIIDEMNKLLAKYENASGDGRKAWPRRVGDSKRGKNEDH